MAKGIVLNFKRDDRLTFYDVAALKVIAEYVERTGTSPTRDELFHRSDYTSIINDWLVEQGVDAIYASPITGSDQLDSTFKVLRRLGFIEAKDRYLPTKKGLDYLARVGHWRSWAISIPISKKNELLEDKARYAPEF